MDVPAETGVAVENFSETFAGVQVHFYVLRLKQSFLVWIGTDNTFSTLAVAMNTRFEAEPCSVQLLGGATNVATGSLAKRLSQKTGCQCFVSLNVPDSSLHPSIEEHLVRAIEANPRTFFF